MAYQHDPDGPVIDKGAFRARIIEVCGIVFIAGIIILIVIKVMHPESKKIDIAIDISKLELKSSPYNYSFESSEDVLKVNLWRPDTVPIAKKAAEGDSDASAEWRLLKDNVLKYANAIDSNLALQDVQEITLIVQLVNEANHDRQLLIYKNCTLIYDVTEGG